MTASPALAATDRVRALRACPWCPAGAGDPCSDDRGRLPGGQVHTARMPVGISPEAFLELDDAAAAAAP